MQKLDLRETFAIRWRASGKYDFYYHQDMKTAQNNYAFIDAANLFTAERKVWAGK